MNGRTILYLSSLYVLALVLVLLDANVAPVWAFAGVGLKWAGEHFWQWLKTLSC